MTDQRLGGDPFDLDADEVRSGSSCKWERYGDEVVAAWIAEMDVAPCPPVAERVAALLAGGTVGYQPDDLPAVLADSWARWTERRTGWAPDTSRARPVTGALAAFREVLLRFTEPGDDVVLQAPVFPPLRALVDALGRNAVLHHAERDGDGWAYDPDRFASLLGPRARLAVVVNPHNPLGVVLGAGAATAWGEVAAQQDLVVVADEVHGAFDTLEHPWVPLGSIDSLSARTITLQAAHKSHNVAGYRCGVAHFGSAELLARWDGTDRSIFWDVSTPGMVATIAAWDEGDEWLDAVLDGIATRRDDLGGFLDEHLPEIEWVGRDATYLAWLDCSALELGTSPAAFFAERALVALADGADYGPGCDQHVRLTFATSGAVLSELLERMVTALDLR